jgi:hypothetical protein
MNNNLLNEATKDQLMDELKERFIDLVFCGNERLPVSGTDEYNFIYVSQGGYIAKRGLSVSIQEHLDYDAKMGFDDYYKGDE